LRHPKPTTSWPSANDRVRFHLALRQGTARVGARLAWR
jgi:hypothetical protein